MVGKLRLVKRVIKTTLAKLKPMVERLQHMQ